MGLPNIRAHFILGTIVLGSMLESFSLWKLLYLNLLDPFWGCRVGYSLDIQMDLYPTSKSWLRLQTEP